MPFALELLAPCGFNCALCAAFQRDKRRCSGCAGGDEAAMRRHCFTCRIRTCESLKETASGFCYDCQRYPCRRLKQLDNKYRSMDAPSMRGNRTSVSMLENLEFIRENGAEAFLEAEKKRWICPDCGGLLCVHGKSCPECGADPSPEG